MTAFEWVSLARNELSLFAAVFFLIGAIDELVIDCTYFWLRWRGIATTARVDEAELIGRPLDRRCAIFIPAWQESAVIGATLRHALAVYPQEDLWVFVGCYRNDPITAAVAAQAAEGDPRTKIVTIPRNGPTCKADCLNHLYRALEAREIATGMRADFVLLHDAEDMVDQAALPLLDHHIAGHDLVQLPVLPLPQRHSIWVAGHYCDEFAEAHAKTMVVRDALGAAIPGAGVGCAISRVMLEKLDESRGGEGPFAIGALTEDYELGLVVAKLGGRGMFLRCRTMNGRLIATRAYFPSGVAFAVRQKARWIHGIALQGWDRLGWSRGGTAVWMQMRDRRGPFAALLLALAYTLIILVGLEQGLAMVGLIEAETVPQALVVLLALNTLALIWRAALRALFTGREHGLAEGLFAIPRIVVSNAIAILAGRKALGAYLASLRGSPVAWDKTDHPHHPATAIARRRK